MINIKEELLETLYNHCEDNIINGKKSTKDTRLKDLNFFINLVKQLEFKNDIPEEIKNCLSPYGTFCDRITFYYDEQRLSLFNRIERAEIITCEITNNLMGCYSRGDKITDNYSQLLFNRTMVFLYHIGIIKHRLWYSISNMPDIHIKINKYNDFNYILFKPNKNANAYLFENMFNEKYQGVLCDYEVFETIDALEYTYEIISYQPKEYGILGLKEDSKKIIFYKPENKYITQRSKNKLKQHNTTKEMIKKLTI